MEHRINLLKAPTLEDVFPAVQRTLRECLREVIKEVTGNSEFWYREAIFEGDLQELRNERPARCVLDKKKLEQYLDLTDSDGEPWKTVTAEEDHLLDDIDFAGLIKLLQYRLQDKCEKIGLPVRILWRMSNLRNDVSHFASGGKKEDYERAIEAYGEAVTGIREYRSGHLDGRLPEERAIAGIFDRYLPALDQIMEDLQLYFGKTEIEPDSTEELEARRFFPYLIVADSTALISEYRNFIFSGLGDIRKIHVFSCTVKALRRRQLQEDLSEREHQVLREVIKRMESVVGDRLSMKYDLAAGENEEENILELVRQREKLCIFTESAELAGKIWRLGRPGVIVAHCISQHRAKLMPGYEGEGSEPGKACYIPKENDCVYLQAPKTGEVRLVRRLAVGGEGTIYECDKFASEVIKIYHRDKLTPRRVGKVQKMLREQTEEQICWPHWPVYNALDEMVGFSMRRAENTMSVEELITRLQASQLTPDFYWTSRSSLVELCRNIALLFAKLHAEDGEVLMGDVNPGNILADFRNGSVWFIDVDSYQYGSWNCTVGREDFSSLRLLESGENFARIPRIRSDENFAVALLYYYILFVREYPYEIQHTTPAESIRAGQFVCRENGGFIWQNLTEELRTMFTDCFMNPAGEGNFDDMAWAEAFRRMLIEIRDKKRLSDQIFPTCALQGASDSFIERRCRNCGEIFESSRESRETEQDLCPVCKLERARRRATVRKVRCPRCSVIFTVNDWDYTEGMYCPDCDPELAFSYRETLSGPDREVVLQHFAEAAENNYHLYGEKNNG